MLNRFDFIWAISTPQQDCGLTSLAGREMLEERARRFAELAVPPLVQLAEFARRVEFAERTIDRQAKVLVAASQRKRERFMRELAVQEDELLAFRSRYCAQHDGAI